MSGWSTWRLQLSQIILWCFGNKKDCRFLRIPWSYRCYPHRAECPTVWWYAGDRSHSAIWSTFLPISARSLSEVPWYPPKWGCGLPSWWRTSLLCFYGGPEWLFRTIRSPVSYQASAESPWLRRIFALRQSLPFEIGNKYNIPRVFHWRMFIVKTAIFVRKERMRTQDRA